jgi:inosine/xanthosine triphosphate pyrophosphatase family protein
LKRRQYENFVKAWGYGIVPCVLDLPEFQSMDVEEVAIQKLKFAKTQTSHFPLLIDDTGVEIEGLFNFPGALVGPILKRGRVGLIAKLCAGVLQEGRVRAWVRTAVVIQQGDTCVTGLGSLAGTLDFNDKDRFDDPDLTGVFYLDGHDVPQNQLPDENDFYIHRFAALEEAITQLQ